MLMPHPRMRGPPSSFLAKRGIPLSGVCLLHGAPTLEFLQSRTRYVFSTNRMMHCTTHWSRVIFRSLSSSERNNLNAIALSGWKREESGVTIFVMAEYGEALIESILGCVEVY